MKKFVNYAALLLIVAMMNTSVFAQSSSKDIVDTAVGNDNFKTLVTAVKAAGLVEALKGDGPFTVFAPTDAAFKKVPEATLKSLLEPANKSKLQDVLKFHVVSGKVLAADVVKLNKATTLQGQDVKIEVKDGVVKVNGAKVTATDIVCKNGVIHVIDTVILPKAEGSAKKGSAKKKGSGSR